MNTIIRAPIFICILLLGIPELAEAQQPVFDFEAYKTFLSANTDMSAGDLLSLHPAGMFQREVGVLFNDALYSDSLRTKYQLTYYEQDLVDRHGFMVTERLSFPSFGDAFIDVHTNDLPVFISTDAILHALHMSYDRILRDTEEGVLIPKLEALLAELHSAVVTLEARYAGFEGMRQPLRDLDVYLTIPRNLLSERSVAPVFPENTTEVNELLELITQGDPAKRPLFSETCRLYDFSQFTPRGHYTLSEPLTRYFQAMIWLGRTEIYLIAPATDDCTPTVADIQRQTVLAVLVTEAAETGSGATILSEIEALIQLFVGSSDNVTLPHLQSLRSQTGVSQATDLLDPENFQTFQNTLTGQAWAIQRIQSQILVNNLPLQPNRLAPASAFLLLGQRFVIDSYVTGSVVYDRISYEGNAVLRMLPSPLDVLFALGNDAAAQLLEPELETYYYGSNLAAVRYLVDSYEPDFWQSTLYNGWLNAIRTLNPPAENERERLPAFMQTAAWWQQKMNTQLAAWAQLRHDNLLYAKQSYTGVPGCSYPYSYVEPIPAFFSAVGTYARNASRLFQNVEGAWQVEYIQAYFDHLAGVSDTLTVIAQKELDGERLIVDEQLFLERVLFQINKYCYEGLDGWYARLFYREEEGAQDVDMVVVDIHTAPADETGSYVGWVLHVGTGPINMAIVVAEVPDHGPVAFVGPVMSYYEHLSSGFERLTDEVWETAYETAPSYRPPFVNLFLADRDGKSGGDAPMLSVGVEQRGSDIEITENIHPPSNYPNPFSEATNITFSVPYTPSYQRVELVVYDLQGRRVRQLVKQSLPAGHYSLRWDGTLSTGTRAASGVYFCHLRLGDLTVTSTMALVR